MRKMHNSFQKIDAADQWFAMVSLQKLTDNSEPPRDDQPKCSNFDASNRNTRRTMRFAKNYGKIMPSFEDLKKNLEEK